MTELSPQAQAVLDAITSVSPAPADEIAAVAFRALAEHGEAMEIRMAPGCYDFDEAVRCRDMEAIAAELEGGASSSSTH